MRLLLALIFLASSLLSHATESGFVQAQRTSRKPVKKIVGPYLILTNYTDAIQLYLKGVGPLSVDWGNGASTNYTLGAVNINVTNYYGSSAPRTVVLKGSISYIDAESPNAASFAGDISTLTSLTNFYFLGVSNRIYGDVSRLTNLKSINITGFNTLSGSISSLPLTYLNAAGSNTMTGSVTGLTNLTYLLWAGNNTGSGSISGLTNLTTLYWAGNNIGSGSVSGLTNLTLLYWAGNNTGSGSVAGLTNLTYLYWTGSNTGSGSVSGLTNLTYLYDPYNHSFTGDAQYLTNCSYINLGSTSTNCTITNLSKWSTNSLTAYGFAHLTFPGMSQSEVDGILNGFWLNRTNTKPNSVTRVINITGYNSAPSAAGLTVKTNLAAYISPPGSTYWTVTTK